MFKALGLILFFMAMAVQIECAPMRKLDESLPPPPATGIQCSMCSSCNNPCNQKPPPPPPSPPPSPKKPKSYCPPPPFYYITGGPPGDLYPVDRSFGNRNLVVEVPILVGCGLLGLLAFWRL